MSLFAAAGSGLRRVGRGMARVQAVIFLTLAYFLVIGPVSLGWRLARRRLLPGRGLGSTFVPARPIEDVEAFGRRQF